VNDRGGAVGDGRTKVADPERNFAGPDFGLPPGGIGMLQERVRLHNPMFDASRATISAGSGALGSVVNAADANIRVPSVGQL